MNLAQRITLDVTGNIAAKYKAASKYQKDYVSAAKAAKTAQRGVNEEVKAAHATNNSYAHQLDDIQRKQRKIKDEISSQRVEIHDLSEAQKKLNDYKATYSKTEKLRAAVATANQKIADAASSTPHARIAELNKKKVTTEQRIKVSEERLSTVQTLNTQYESYKKASGKIDDLAKKRAEITTAIDRATTSREKKSLETKLVNVKKSYAEQTETAKTYRESLSKQGISLNRHSETQKQLNQLAKSAQKSLKAERAELTKIENEQRQATKAIPSHQAKVKRLRTHIKSLTSDYQKQVKQASALAKTLNRSNIDVKNIAKSERLLTAKTLSANTALEAQQKKLESLDAAESKLHNRREWRHKSEMTRNERLLNAQQYIAQRRDRNINRITQAIREKTQQRNNHARQAVMSAAPTLLAGASVVNKAATLESAMIEVDKKINFRNADGSQVSKQDERQRLAKIQDWIVSAAPELGVKPADLAMIVASGAGANVARAGQEMPDLAQFAELSAKMSIAFDGLNPEDAGQSVATWMASMGLDLKQAAELASTINHLSDNSAANTAALTELTTRSGSILMDAGLSHRQAVALGAAILSANGNRADMGATAAKNMAITLSLGDAMSGGQQRALTKLGLDPVQLAQNMQRDAVSTTFNVIERLQQLPDHQRTSVVTTLFGRESLSGINPLIKNAKEFKRVMVATNDDQQIKISLEREFQKQAKSTQFKQKQLSASYDALSAAIGVKLLPYVNAGIDALSAAMDAGAQFIGEYQGLADVLIPAIAAIAAFKTGMLAWRVVASTLDMLTLKRKLTEQKLGRSISKNAGLAIRTAAALDRLAASVARVNATAGATPLSSASKGKRRRKGKAARSGFGAALASKTSGLTAAARASKALPVVGTMATAGIGAYGLYNLTNSGNIDNKHEQIGETVGSIGGSLAGAAAGAALGSMVPVVGTVIGGLVGAIAGEQLIGWIGGELGAQFDNNSHDSKTNESTTSQTAANSISSSNNLSQPQKLITPKQLDVSTVKTSEYNSALLHSITNSAHKKDPVSVTYSPVINLPSNTTPDQFQQVLEKDKPRFTRTLNDVLMASTGDTNFGATT